MKCYKCKKNNYIILDCKCKKNFCIKHLNNHKCSYDYKEEQKIKIQKENPKIIKDKIPKI